MRRWMLSVILVLAMLMLVSFVGAQDDKGPKPGTPEDNLCNEGGAWDDGRCDIPDQSGSTELAWKCGWYMARYYAGLLRADQVSADCQHTIPVDEPAPIVDPCITRFLKPLSLNARWIPPARGC